MIDVNEINLERRLALRSEKLTIDEKIALWKGL